MDDAPAGRRNVLGAARIHRLRPLRLALAPVDVGHRRGVDDEVGASHRLGDRGPVGHVEVGPREKRRLGQVGAQGQADLAARARYENVGTSSQSSPGF